MSVFLTAFRWIARSLGLLVFGGFVLLVIAELAHPHSSQPSTLLEWTGIVLLTSTCTGLLLAWRWELPGAVISLASLGAFTLLMRMGRYGVIVALAIPGILYIADWLLHRRRMLASGS